MKDSEVYEPTSVSQGLCSMHNVTLYYKRFPFKAGWFNPIMINNVTYLHVS